MFKNYLKTAWRNLLKNKLYSSINIGGLAIGMAVSFMLLLYVYNEYSFDKFNTNSDRLYQVLRNQPVNGEVYTSSSTPAPLAATIRKDFPEIDKISLGNNGYDVLINYKDKGIKLNTMSADTAFMDMFTFQFIYGERRTAFKDISSIILTETGAKALFGNTNPVGQLIKFDNKFPLKVSGVIKDNPVNSRFQFKAFISWSTYTSQQQWVKSSGWGNYSFNTYVLLKPGASLTALNAKLKGVIAHYNPLNKENSVFLYAFTQGHLYGKFKDGKVVGGTIEYVRLFLLLAIGILIIACINFMNLSTARSERRSREVGVRKAIGARRRSLILQFLGESLMMAFFSLIFALLLMVVMMPYFCNIINIKLALPYNNIRAWLAIVSVTVFTGLVAGSYPALFLSSFKPVKVLKGQLATSKTTIRPRQALVIVQFTFAICLILSSLFIYKQINYIKDLPIGYDRNNIVEFDPEGNMYTKFESFRQDAINAGAIIDGAMTSGSITNNQSSTWGVTWPGQLPGEDKIPIDQIAVSYHFTSTYGLTLLKGRDYAQDRPGDSTTIILNESAVKMMRLKNPLGSIVKWQDVPCTVIGVVKDFVWGSPYEPVKPAIIGFNKGWTGGIGLKLNPKQSASKSIATLTAIYKKYNTEFPFEYKFADDSFAKKFNSEKLLGTMSSGFTCLAIVISCLGLIGLATFSAEQRRKEIGIRKVLGATTTSLWLKLSQEFVALVLIAFVIGSAISYYTLKQWLIKYTYHTDLSLWVFALTMILAVAICLLTVSWQAIKAAWTNPVKNLRSE